MENIDFDEVAKKEILMTFIPAVSYDDDDDDYYYYYYYY